MNIFFSHCLERLLLHETSRQAIEQERKKKMEERKKFFLLHLSIFFQFPVEKKECFAAAAIINSFETHESDKTAEEIREERVNGVWVGEIDRVKRRSCDIAGGFEKKVEVNYM
jgi:hypothetical protein